MDAVVYKKFSAEKFSDNWSVVDDKDVEFYKLADQYYKEYHFKPGIRNDSTAQDTEVAEIFDADDFDDPFISEDGPACHELIVWAEIDLQGSPGQQFIAGINRIAIELPFPENLDGPRIYVGGYWRFNSYWNYMYPQGAEENLSIITADAIDRARNRVVELVNDNAGEFIPILLESGEVITPTIWDDTEYWGYTVRKYNYGHC